MFLNDVSYELLSTLTVATLRMVPSVDLFFKTYVTETHQFAKSGSHSFLSSAFTFLST
jgi:hypothetical protein